MNSFNKPTIKLYSAIARKSVWSIQKKLREACFLKSSSKQNCNFVFLYYPHPIPESQYYPFHYYRKAISDQLDLQIQHLDIQEFETKLQGTFPKVKYVALQTWFDISSTNTKALFGQIKQRFPNAKIIYFDWFAPTDIRLAETLNPHVDLYVKKNSFANADDYYQDHYGDTNLMDYYGQLYNIPQEKKCYTIPDGYIDKLITGPSFLTAPYLIPLLAANKPPFNLEKKPLDLHARLGAKGTEWYTAMRTASIKAVNDIGLDKVVTTNNVGFREYLLELEQSKITFSPFGYGEVCWRDYEAIALGSLLIKPDMSHMITEPNLFIANETYVPVKWDFSDLKEKVEYYLTHHQERNRIVMNAYQHAHGYFHNQQFLNHVEKLL